MENKTSATTCPDEAIIEMRGQCFAMKRNLDDLYTKLHKSLDQLELLDRGNNIAENSEARLKVNYDMCTLLDDYKLTLNALIQTQTLILSTMIGDCYEYIPKGHY